MSDLSGQRIVVTGTASGMGAALLAPLVEAGARVVSLDLGEARGRAEGEPAGIAGFERCDVSDKASVDGAFARAAALLGGLDTLVHAAGIAPAAPAAEITPGGWDQVFAVMRAARCWPIRPPSGCSVPMAAES